MVVEEAAGQSTSEGPVQDRPILDVISAKEATLARRDRQGFAMGRVLGREVPAAGAGDQPGALTVQQPLPDAGISDVLRQ